MLCGMRKAVCVVVYYLHDHYYNTVHTMCVPWPVYLFVDLRKAYDSVPWQALWCVLEKYGVPPTMVSVIKSFHEGMTAVVRVGDSITDDIEVTNGLRQG